MIKIALAGNPNVGKSTIFNTLTGMKQHTGNWPGKTVSNAVGNFTYNNKNYELYDLPGTYSLISHSEEETVARDFLCYEKSDLVIVVCDSLCLERNMNLVLQIMEITKRVIVVVNLMDEAKKKKVTLNLKLLEEKLGVPVVGTSARSKMGIKKLLETIDNIDNYKFKPYSVSYNEKIEEEITNIEKKISKLNFKNLNSRWVSIKLLGNDKEICTKIESYLHVDIRKNYKIKSSNSEITDSIVSSIMSNAEEIVKNVVKYENKNYNAKTRKIDHILTSKLFGIPCMLILLLFVFWLTIIGANYPSSLLYDILFKLEKPLMNILVFLKVPNPLIEMIVSGGYRTLAWVTSVMLPPMAIFFPLFSILEDLGYLPRIAFNLDRCFQKCKACGKQALTMCMGFGCNAVGVTGCRIIDSKRERLIAILTNSFIPCNGRFPTLLAIISIFFIGSSNSNLLKGLILTGVILLGIIVTLFISWLLSRTILKGTPSSFTLELPSYRKPQFIKVIIHSIFNKTLHVLGRAVIVALPTGLLIWLLANININGTSILSNLSMLLDPFGKLIGLDGVVLISFILGFPANEIVIPIMIMTYMSLGNITDFSNLQFLKDLLLQNNWTILTAINMIIITLFHFPCSTTCLTIKKETGSIKWVLYSILLPMLTGIILCLITTSIYKIFF